MDNRTVARYALISHWSHLNDCAASTPPMERPICADVAASVIGKLSPYIPHLSDLVWWPNQTPRPTIEHQVSEATLSYMVRRMAQGRPSCTRRGVFPQVPFNVMPRAQNKSVPDHAMPAQAKRMPETIMPPGWIVRIDAHQTLPVHLREPTNSNLCDFVDMHEDMYTCWRSVGVTRNLVRSGVRAQPCRASQVRAIQNSKPPYQVERCSDFDCQSECPKFASPSSKPLANTLCLT